MPVFIEHEKPYVVYYHLIDDHIFYIGSGVLSRAFDHGASRRNEVWNLFAAGRPVKVWVQSYYTSRADARRVEYAAIKAIRPVANWPLERGEPLRWLSRPGLHRAAKSAMKPYTGDRFGVRPYGEYYATIAEAARRIGYSPSAVSNHLSGKHPIVGEFGCWREPIPADCLHPFTLWDAEGQRLNPERASRQEYVRQLPSDERSP